MSPFEKLAEHHPTQILGRLVELAAADESAALREAEVELATLAESLGLRFEGRAWPCARANTTRSWPRRSNGSTPREDPEARA